MKKRPVLPLVLSMSLPMVLSMMVTSLYNIIDSYFVAKISEDAMTALSLIFPIQNFINAVTIGFSIGVNAVISYHLGAKQNTKANIIATQGIFLNTIHGIILTLLCILISPLFLNFFTDNQNVIDLGLKYSRIAFSFAVIISLGMTFEKIFQAVGKMKLTMLSMLSGCIANIILDPILIFGIGIFPKMGIEGAALATGIGQTISLIIYIAIYIFKPIHVKVSKKYLYKSKIDKKLYFIGIPVTLNLALPSLLVSSLNVILAAYSQAYVVVLGIYYKLQTFLYLPTNGIVQGIRPLIGYNYGAGEHLRVKNIYRTALYLSILIMLLGTVLCWVIPSELIGLFTTNKETILIGSKALQIISIGFIISSISVISSGALEGLGMGLPSLLISLFRYTIIIVPVAFIFNILFGAIGVWHAFWVAEFFTAIISYFIYKKATSKENLKE